MHFVDLHIHSKYSRATSKDLDLENLARYAKMKGLDVLGTGDFSHPQWNQELRQRLVEADGIYEYNGIKFILSNEISLVYTQGGKGRRIHHLILSPTLEIADQINEFLKSKGRVDYDGRPIFGFSSIELVERLMGISKDIMVIPAHAWTPWFGIFGSMSGFDSLEECFQEKTKHIHAIETGLSSNPEMNWRLSSLDNISLVSFSDAHSAYPWRLGRECCAFDCKPTYNEITGAIKEKDKKKFLFTIEFFPEEGKYHFDGHRNCNFSCEPQEAKKLNNICPRCGNKLTIGVLNRVEELADREEDFVPENSIPFKSLIPLSELIAAALGTTPYSKGTWEVYSRLIDRFKNEFNVALNVSKEDLEKVVDRRIAEIILKNREGQIEIKPGYDGVYGKIMLDVDKENNLKRFI
ncbi:MAG: DNA helicase UvrD [Candidatus Aenigmarchaeota archaeon]|nr:DNA helicase UvrD [Candidatus Aenigmarchaeota archaeon]